MLRFQKLFPSKCSVIGMVHAAAFPGTPSYGDSIEKIINKACEETDIYVKNHVDGLIVENMHDVPYIQSKYFGPETVAVMTRICTEIRKVAKSIPCGIQILTGGNKEALAIAKACNFNFIRSEGFVFSHIGDEGFVNADAGHILRYRKSIDAGDILVFTDVKKKHSSHAITSDVSLVETAKAAEFFLSDGIILTGTSTGTPADMKELKDLKENSQLPILVGSGVTCDNLKNYLDADAFIIGSHFKHSGFWRNNVSHERVNYFVNIIREIKEKDVDVILK